MGSAWLLPRIVGLSRATEMLLTGDFVSAEEAHRIGLYNKVVPQDKVMEEARAMAEKLAKGPSYALTATKLALEDEAHMDFVGALEYEAKAQAKCMESPNFREAYEAFTAKRETRFV